MESTGDPERDLTINTQNILKTTEIVIRQNPSQWVWMHERWKTQPGEEIR
jgi:KDO2-lipid IV(A) lauroyltransferase